MKRPLLVGVVVVAILGGALVNAGRDQDNARQQQALAQMTATTVASNTRQAVAQATRQADGAIELAQAQATATQGAATLAAYRANLDATVQAGQVSARATNTALARVSDASH